ncbi:MAG: hypothetical protein H7144_11090 [Burkholderiales bacterium]|nr:hypothetical protein [Phycisphaerae bacterium]
MTDSLIEEVRDLRRRFIEASGEDLDALAQELKRLETEFINREGRFAGVPLELNAELFPAQTMQPANAVVEEVRPPSR